MGLIYPLKALISLVPVTPKATPATKGIPFIQTITPATAAAPITKYFEVTTSYPSQDKHSSVVLDPISPLITESVLK